MRRSSVFSVFLVVAANGWTQELPPGLIAKDPVVYKVRVATSFRVPEKRDIEQVRVWHALPTLRPWSGVSTKFGASDVTISAGGKQQYEKAHDSHHAFFQKTTELKQGAHFEFVTQFTVRSVHREFHPGMAKVAWEQYADKDLPKPGPRQVHREIADVADKIKSANPPPLAVLEFCKWLGNKLKYDASVSYPPSDVASTLEHCKGHCGHYYNVFKQLCDRSGVSVRVVVGLNLYKPGGRGGLHAIRADYTNVHTWAEVYFPGVGWVEVEPANGKHAFKIPAQFIQNNRWFQNYAIWIRENGQERLHSWNYKDGKYSSDFGVELLITYAVDRPSVPGETKGILPESAFWRMRFDATLDGQLKNASEVKALRLVVRNKRILGDEITGEIVPGKSSIVALRQDSPNGLSVFYNGKRTQDGRISGTWFNTFGQSGDFELTAE